MQTKSCKQCNKLFDIIDGDLKFYNKISPVFGSEKFQIPTPSLCPDCRQQRRLAWRNERSLYKRVCNITGKEIISTYSPDKKYKVYNPNYWWSDEYDELLYGLEFDFEKTFFEQFEQLMIEVPKFSVAVFASENCDYNNFVGKAKDCYYSFAGGISEKIFYSFWFGRSSNIFDGFNVIKSDNLYECVGALECRNSLYLYSCQGCSNSIFLQDCIGCIDCIACIGLSNKQYYIGNKKYTKEEYLKRRKELELQEIEKLFQEVYKNTFFQNLSILNCENCTGNHLKNSKNLIQSYNSEFCIDCKNIFWGFELKDCFDIDCHNDASLLFEIISGAFTQKCLFNIFCNESDNLIYCDNCFSSHHCFGCTGLKSKSYCILNKQYTKEEYNKIVPKIIKHMQKTGEWGEFFPKHISPFGYNETIAQDYKELTKEEAKAKGFNWLDYEAPFPKVQKTIPAEKLPDSIADIPDDVLNWAIICEDTKKPFLIIKEELMFYRRYSLPLPKKHPNKRHQNRIKLRGPNQTFNRECDKCKKNIQAIYALDRPERIYCEECYNKEIY